MFSKACEYGIRSSIFITSSSLEGKRVNLSDISTAIDSPSAFTAKILQKLVKGGVVNSVKGPHGGFEISQEAMAIINLENVVKAIDGDTIYNGCGLGLKQCNELKPCPLHDRFKEVRGDLKKMLKGTTLKDLAIQLKDGTTFLKL